MAFKYECYATDANFRGGIRFPCESTDRLQIITENNHTRSYYLEETNHIDPS
jgi:hypothetical protein